MINLDMNENRCIDSISINYKDINLNNYPRNLSCELTKKLAKKLNVCEDSIVLTNGIDEGIYMFCNYISKHSWSILVDLPNYIGIIDAINYFGINAVFNHQEESYDCQKTIKCLESHQEIKAIYIANPRNPIGDYLIYIGPIISYCAENGIVVFLDEAYIEFCQKHIFESLDYMKFGNLVIARTFSKAYGLASIRVGYMVASSPKLAKEFRKMWQVQPYHISQYSLECALLALDDDERIRNSLAIIRQQKEKLYCLLEHFSVPYIKTETNFICVKNLENFEEFLKCRKIKVMPTEAFGYNGFLRITIGNHSEMRYLFQVITEFFGGNYETI